MIRQRYGSITVWCGIIATVVRGPNNTTVHTIRACHHVSGLACLRAPLPDPPQGSKRTTTSVSRRKLPSCNDSVIQPPKNAAFRSVRSARSPGHMASWHTRQPRFPKKWVGEESKDGLRLLISQDRMCVACRCPDGYWTGLGFRPSSSRNSS